MAPRVFRLEDVLAGLCSVFKLDVLWLNESALSLMWNSSSEADILGNEDFPVSLLVFKALGDSAILNFCSWLDCLTKGTEGEMFPDPDLEIVQFFCPFAFFPRDENLTVPITDAAS